MRAVYPNNTKISQEINTIVTWGRASPANCADEDVHNPSVDGLGESWGVCAPMVGDRRYTGEGRGGFGIGQYDYFIVCAYRYFKDNDSLPERTMSLSFRLILYSHSSILFSPLIRWRRALRSS